MIEQTRQETPAHEAFFGVITDPASYKRLGYLLASFPLGILYFVALITGISLGISLSIIWVGLPILLAVLGLSYMFTGLERSLANSLLDMNIPPADRAQETEGLLDKLRALLTHPTTWKGISFQLLKFPLGIVSFVLVVVLMAVSVGFIAAPVATLIPGVDPVVLWWETGISPLVEALILSVCGLIMLPVSMHLLNGFAWLHGQIAAAMLGDQGAAFE